MFGWLLPSSCPCDSASKAWVEERLAWLEDEFDDHAFNGRRIVLPTREFFPDGFNGTERGVHDLLDLVCDFMDVDRALIDLQFFNPIAKVQLETSMGDAISHDPAGTFEELGGTYRIRIQRGQLAEPMDLVGTLAHELAHVRLLGEYRLTGDAYDNELLTDLTVCFFGLGVFLANSPRNWDSQATLWPGTRMYKPEYMSPPMFGYALAHLAWFRGETKPTWAAQLHPNARAEFHQSLRFLHKTGDSAFKPKRLRAK